MAGFPKFDADAATTADLTTVAATNREPKTIPPVLPPMTAPILAPQEASQRRSAPPTSAAATTFLSASEALSLAAPGDLGSPVRNGAPSVCRETKAKDDSIVHADVLIVGTGLVGCLTAAALARRGLKVVQIDGKGVYGGAYKSLKLSELCDWVKAENCEKAQPSRCYSQTATPYGRVVSERLIATPTGASVDSTVAVAPPAEISRQVESSAAARFNEVVATVGTVGGKAATVIPPATADSKPEARLASPFTRKTSTTKHGTPVSTLCAVYEGAASNRSSKPLQQESVGRCQHYLEEDTETAPTGGIPRSPKTPSTCAAFSRGNAVYPSEHCTVFGCPELVCSLEEYEEGLSFSLHREKQDPPPSPEQTTAIIRPENSDLKDNEEWCPSASAVRELFHRNSVKTCAPVPEWGDSEHVFFSSRSFAFFPFATEKAAQHAAQFNHSIQEKSVCFKETPSHLEKAVHTQLSGKKSDTAATAIVAKQEQKSVRAADTEGATCAAAADKVRPESGLLFDGLVGSTPTPTTEPPCGGLPLDDKETLIKKLLKRNDFNIDLLPRVLYSNSAITHILVTCGAAKYLEFRPVDAAVYLGELDADIPDKVLCGRPERHHYARRACSPKSVEHPHLRPHPIAGKCRTAAASAVFSPRASSVPESKSRVHGGTGQASRPEGTRFRSESGTRTDSYSWSPASAFAGSQKKAPCFSDGSYSFKGRASEKSALQRRIDDVGRSVVGGSQREREMGRRNSGGGEKLGGKIAKGCSEEGDDDEGDRIEEELVLVQMPLTRGSIFSSSLLSTQEKRLLMKFVSNVAAPKLNNQFLSAARLWVANKQALATAYFGGGSRHAEGSATARAAPAQVGGSAGAAGPGREDDSSSKGREGDPGETANEAAPNEHDTFHISQQRPVKSDVRLDHMSWEAYLQFHQLTEKLQRFLSYGVCVSDFPLRSRTSVRSQEPKTCSASTAKTAVPEKPGAEQSKAKKLCEGVDRANGRRSVTGGWKASEGHARLLNFLQSVGLYENHSGAWLYPIYGTGDLPQALARAASLSGGVYMLCAGLAELKVVCSQSLLFASSSRFARYCVSTASSYLPSAIPPSLPGLHAAVDATEDGGSKSKPADESTVLSKLKFFFCKEGDSCTGGVSFFLSMFHKAMANAEALEAKLRNGITVKTRMLLFEADALPPLSERVRLHMNSRGFSQAGQGCAGEAGRTGYVVDYTSSAEILARYSAAGARLSSDTVLYARQPSADGAGESVRNVEEAVKEQNRISPAGDDEAATSRSRGHAGEKWDRLCAQSVNEQPTLCLGELLFPAWGPGRAWAPASCVCSQQRERQGGTTMQTDRAGRRKRKVATEEQSSVWTNGLPIGETASVEGERRQIPQSIVDPNDAAQTVRGETDGRRFGWIQEKEKRVGEATPACNTQRSQCDYYTQASCHLIAVCSRALLNGPGFRMCVCTVRSRQQSTFSAPTYAASDRCRASSSSHLESLGFISSLKQDIIWENVADDTTASGTSFAMSSTVVAEGQTGFEEGVFRQRRGAPTGIAELPSQTPLIENTLSETPVSLRVLDSAGSATSVETASRASASDSGKSHSAEGVFKSTCSLEHARLSGREATMSTRDEARSAGSSHSTVGLRSPSTRRAGHAWGLSEATGEFSAASQRSHADASVAWPVLVLQTDGTCGTAPADYVLIHLSHIDGAGVENCGCSFRREVSGKSSNLEVEDERRQTFVLQHKKCTPTAPPGTTGHFRLRGDVGDIPNLTGHDAALPPAVGAAPQSSADISSNNASRGGHGGLACENNESRPCQMLMYVLRRLLERGRHRRAAADDCLFVCGYVSRTLRSEIQEHLQAWQSTKYRGVVWKNSKFRTVSPRRRSSDEHPPFSEEGTQSRINQNHASGPACPRYVEAAPDPAGVSTAATSSSDESFLDVTQQSPGVSDRDPDMIICGVAGEAPGLAKKRRCLSQARERIASKHTMSEENSECESSPAVRQCGCLLLPAVPSTPLWFLLEEPKASQGVLEVLLDQQIDVADLVPPPVGHEAEAAADELQRLSAPYQKLSEIVAPGL